MDSQKWATFDGSHEDLTLNNFIIHMSAGVK